MTQAMAMNRRDDVRGLERAGALRNADPNVILP